MANSKRGFTLIELLVVIAIIALLLAILMPSLQMAKLHARNVLCLTNLRSIGEGLFLFADRNEATSIRSHDNVKNGRRIFGKEGQLPFNDDDGHPFTAYRGDKDWETYGTNGMGSPTKRFPMKLGWLFETGVIEEPKTFYCSATPSRIKGFRYESYTNPGVWGTLPQTVNDSSTDGVGDIVGQQWIRVGYDYYPQSAREKWPDASGGKEFPKITTMRIKLSSNYTIVTDVLRNWDSLGHVKSGKPRNINALFGDGHASSTVDVNHERILNHELWLKDPSLPPDTQTNNRQMRPFRSNDQWGDENLPYHTVLSLLEP